MDHPSSGRCPLDIQFMTLLFRPWACTCVDIMLRRHLHAIDATLSPWPRRLDGVEAHEGIN